MAHLRSIPTHHHDPHGPTGTPPVPFRQTGAGSNKGGDLARARNGDAVPVRPRRESSVVVVAAYDADLWHDYFVAAAGASAALTGLLFVAISINLQQIIREPSLPRRALCTLSVLVALLVAALFCLAPAQSRLALGLEVAMIGGVVAIQTLVLHQRSPRSTGEPRFARPAQVGLLVAPTAVLAVGGLSIAVDTGGGLYWVMAAFALGFIGATVNAWVFLVEIQR